jgi:lipid II:glycine glycyltransferase (peptidoglycan interpeptide bridge formation enzyme)
MTVRTRRVTDRIEWDSALAALPQPHVLQTWDWGEFKRRWGWQADRLLFEEEGHPFAAAQVLRRRLSRTPLSIMYVPKGPILDYAERAGLIQVLAVLEQETRRQGSLFVKIDPDVWLGSGADETPPLPTAAAVVDSLVTRGWQLSPEQIQFKNTVSIDLTPDEATLLDRMKPKTRYNIRLPQRRGVQLRRGSQADLQAFYSLYSETSQRNQFLIRPLAYYLDVWTQFLKASRAHLLLAEIEHVPVAGLMLFHFKETAWYMYGASASQQRDVMPNHLLQWEAIRLAKQLGCTRYDMWGAPDRFDESDPMWGVYRFKVGFGSETLRGMGAFDYTPRRWLYRLYHAALPRILEVMRRRQGTAGKIQPAV